MPSSQRHAAIRAGAACAFVAALLFVRISAFGIWDPWELGTADAARRMSSGELAPHAGAFSTWLVSLGFRAFGIHEWAGRAPIALSGVLTAMVAYVLVARYAGRRAGLYALLITGTSPLFLFNARAMLGVAPGIAAQAAVGLCAISAVVARPGSALTKGSALGGWLALLVGVCVLSALISGVLLGPLPPLAAAAITAWLFAPTEPERPTAARLTRLGVTLSACTLAALSIREVARDATTYSIWLGGRAGASAPQTFDAVIEKVFHAFAPWSALLPLAIGTMWLRAIRTREGASNTRHTAISMLSCALLLWAAFGYAAQTIFLSRYGQDIAFLPLVALAALVALFLRDIEQRDDGHWGAGVAALFLTGLLIRDYALYPGGPVSGMPLAAFDVPKVFNPKVAWAALLAVFGTCSLLGLGATPESPRPSLLAPYRFIRAQWHASLGHKLWLGALGLATLALCVFGALALAMPEKLHLTTLAAKWSRRALLLVPVIPVAVALAQLAPFLFGKLRSLRLLPLLVAGAAVGTYAAQGFLPALSEHFSPREVYETYNALAKPDEALGEYRVGGRAAAYYAKGPVVELKSSAALVEHMMATERRWAAFPADDLAALDRAYRKRAREHLVLADTRSARVVLATNQPLAGKREPHYLEKFVRDAPPATIQHPVAVSFDERVELLGYDLALPHDGFVGAGESFKITWYFKSLRAVSGDFRIFVHIDGQGQRIHGDHEPVDGKYPVRLWEEGDVIVDVQEIDVPASYRGGEYAIYLGFFSGNTRLPIKSGPNDGADRARVGVLRIR